MTETEETLKAYNDTKALADLNLENVPLNVRPGRESQKRNAIANLRETKFRYGTALMKAAFAVNIQGPGTDEFVKLAREEAEVLVADAADMYRRIADRLNPTMSDSRIFGVSQFSGLIQELRNIASELGVSSMPSPQWSEPVNVGDAQGLLNHVRTVVDSSAGPELLALYVKSQLTDAGIEEGSDKNTVPVLITGLTEAMAVDLLTKAFPEGRTLLVTTTKDVNKEFVLDTFNKIKKQLKTNKKN